MLSLRKPNVDRLRSFLAEQADLSFTYTAVGATAATPPAGFTVDHTRLLLGSGQSTFRAAKAALDRWQQFRLGWVEAWATDMRLETGRNVAIMGWAVGFWWLNACRIVYTIDESGATNEYGFAYGTLPGHVECGEERFLIQWDRDSDQVWYDILAFSKPNHILTRIGYPQVRRSQKRFGRESATAMFYAVHEPTDSLPAVLQHSTLASGIAG